MNTQELEQALRQLRLGGLAAVLQTRIIQARTEKMDYTDFLSVLVGDELNRRNDRRSERRLRTANFRDHRTLDGFDFDFNKKMNRKLVFNLATGDFVDKHEDGLFLGPPGTGKSHLAQAIGRALVLNGVDVRYFEAHVLLETLCEAQLDGTKKKIMNDLQNPALLIIDDLGMRKLPASAADDLLEIIMRRYERASTLLTSNRPLEDWGKMLGDVPAVTAMLDRLLHHAHVLNVGPRSWRMKSRSESAVTEDRQ
jgi:DNA replication protein DnaC